MTYDSSDYSTSSIETYTDGTVLTNPIGKEVGGVTYYNQEPNVGTPFVNGSKAGTLKPLDSVRWIKSPSRNVRDLGGWTCDGGTVKYGKLFRGGEISASDTDFIKTMHDEIGIRAELELQGADVAEDYSVIGTDLDLVPGDLYIVIWDNTPYTCRAYSNYRYIYLGNASLATSEMEDTGEPFYIGIYCAPEPTAASYSNTNDTVYVKIENSGGTHSIQINKDTTIIHTIDSKYIPNDILRTTQQALTEMQQAQVRYNIGASDFDGNYNDLYNKPNLIGKSGNGQYSEIFNDYTTNSAIGKYSHVEGYKSKAGNYVSHAEGFTTQANGQYSHAEGYQSIAQEGCSHAEGSVTIASGNASHAEGQGSIASGQTAHAEGYSTNAMGHSSHAEGRGSNDIPSSITTSTNKDTIITTWETTKFNLAKYDQCHTEGDDTLALDSCAHAEGYETIAAGGYSHSEGYKTRAMGTFTHTEGEGTIASSANQHVQGRYNIEDSNSKYLHIVGNGNSNTNRSNAHTVDKNGNGWFAGTIEGTAMILKSSTPNSTKRFKITVDDSGAISTTEIN